MTAVWIIFGAVVIVVVLVGLDTRRRESRRKPISRRALALALIVVPLISIPAYLVGDNVGNEIVASQGVREALLLPALVAPALLSAIIAHGRGPTTWFMASALGIVSGGIAAFVLLVAFVVGCSATDCIQ
jgi:hypothetical protein